MIQEIVIITVSSIVASIGLIGFIKTNKYPEIYLTLLTIGIVVPVAVYTGLEIHKQNKPAEDQRVKCEELFTMFKKTEKFVDYAKWHKECE